MSGYAQLNELKRKLDKAQIQVQKLERAVRQLNNNQINNTFEESKVLLQQALESYLYTKQ